MLARPMARLLNFSNAKDYQRALDALGTMPGDTVLELGFGGGVGVDALLRQGVHVMAKEPSLSMRARAYRRWAWQLAQGQLEVGPQGAEELTDERVSRALSLNTVYFWRNIELGFSQLRRVVETRVVLGISPPDNLLAMGFKEQGYRVETVQWYQERLASAGFQCTVIAAPQPGSCSLLIGD